MLLFNQNLFYVKIYDLQLENKVVKWSKMLFVQTEDIVMVTKILLIFAVLAALDRIFGNKLKLGEEFEKGINMFGPLVLAMLGMMILAPVITKGLENITWILPDFIDFSIIPASLLANDTGAAVLARDLSVDKEIGNFNGLVVSSMMGCTISYLIPYALQMTSKENHKDVLLGILCGIVTIPVGCIVSGIICGINFITLIINQIPLILFAFIIVVGLLKFEKITVKVLEFFGKIIQAVITVGIMVAIIEFMTGYKVIPYADTIENTIDIIVSIVGIMVCALPLLYIVKKIFAKPLKMMGNKLGINETSAFGFITTLGTSLTTFEMADKMDSRGIVLNSAFAVSASFALIDHFAFTMSMDERYVVPMLVGKIISGVTAVVVAYILLGKKEKSQA